MIRIACLMVQKDEELLLRPWLFYHGYLFGFENLHVWDRGSALDQVRATLTEFAKLGVHVDFLPAEGDDAGPASLIGAKVALLRLQGRHDIVLPMAPNEFLAVRTPDGLICHRSRILDELEAIRRAGHPAIIEQCFDSRAGFVDLFRYLPHRRWVIPVGAFSGIDDALSQAALAPGQETSATQLIHIRMGAKPFAGPAEEAAIAAHYADPEPDGRPAIRFRGLARVLNGIMAFSAFRAAWEAGRPADVLDRCVEIDLDRIAFSAQNYLEANPDLAGIDPFAHFVSDGFMEGRALDGTRNARDDVMTRMATIRERRNDGIAGYKNLAASFLWAARPQEAEAVLEDAIARFGETCVLLNEYGMSALNLGRVDEAARRWEDFRSRYPDHPNGYEFGYVTQMALGDFDAADHIVRAGLVRFPDRLPLLIAQADIAAKRGDWHDAKELWNVLLRDHPGHAEIKEKSRETFYNVMAIELDEYVAAAAPIGGVNEGAVLSEERTKDVLSFLHVADKAEIADFFAGFESLGTDCEFGLVQRYYGAEPISLFRWTGIQSQNLITGLEFGFEGLDDPDNLVLREYGSSYVVCDLRYNTIMHTFAYGNQVSPKDLLDKFRRRLSFLFRNYREDIAAGEKIFVHFNSTFTADHQVDRLRAAFRRHGRSPLLYVRVADHKSQIGRVEDAGDGLLLGYIGRAVAGPLDEQAIDFDGWLAVCRAAAAHVGALVPG